MKTLGEIQPGQTVGRYEFLVPIAQGGMAAVWAARLKGSRGFTKTVAVKTMLPTISDDPNFEQMFLDEAQLASRIRHPNVVEILDLGEQDDLLYLVMEWVDGEPLSSIRRAAAKKEGIPRPVAVKVVQDACAGLNAAHELKDDQGSAIGLVHRDISPQNILITYDGVVKIVDFGVAKAAGRTAEHTNSGQIKGKPPYMSPEQALGKDVDRRTDVFALGIILYQLTTGKHPFRGENDVITLQNIVSDRPIIPPRAYDKEYPKPLEAVVMRTLNRDPDKRFQTTAELEAALDRVFPPTVPRVRTEDVGKFVTAMLGERGEERRTALRDALKQADERAASVEEQGPGRALGELGTRVGVAALQPSQAPRNSLGSIPSAPSVVTGPTPGSAPYERPSIPELTSSALSIPETPFGTQLVTTPPAKKGGMGFVWILGGLILAALCVGGAFVLKQKFRPNTTTSPVQVGAQPPAEQPVAVGDKPTEEKKPTSDEPKTEENGAIDLNQLAVEKKRAASGHVAPVKPGTKEEPKGKDPKEKDPKEKTVKKPGGFVPPPVTDPGF